jgi:dTDP-4-dehydrorhamnose 3,5-epimerase
VHFSATPLSGAFTIELEKKADDRGFFARSFCQDEFRQHGLEQSYVQMNNSFNLRMGTLRGLHYQAPPYAEVKVVRCISGALWDVIADLRTSSPSFGQWFGVELTASNRRMMYVPKGFAHGFITLEDNTEAIYLVSTTYSADAERGVRWDDAFFGIGWPIAPTVISEKDRIRPNFDPRDRHYAMPSELDT